MAVDPQQLAGLTSVPELEFTITDAQAPRDAATPVIALALSVSADARWDVQSLLLDCQIRIAPRRRSYPDPDEQVRLRDLFGAPEQWSRSLQGLLWANVPVAVPRFRGTGLTPLNLPCTYDFEVSHARYASALADGVIPLEVLFSGTMFWAGPDGAQRVARVPLDREATFDLPVSMWREAMDRHFPHAAWLRMSRDRFARLQAYRAQRTLPSWDAVLDSLLADFEADAADPEGAP
ncbi:MAG: DUF6084 family protein [Solirubrobacterales bacterium]